MQRERRLAASGPKLRRVLAGGHEFEDAGDDLGLVLLVCDAEPRSRRAQDLYTGRTQRHQFIHRRRNVALALQLLPAAVQEFTEPLPQLWEQRGCKTPEIHRDQFVATERPVFRLRTAAQLLDF